VLKTDFIGWTSTECSSISSIHNFMSYIHYFRKLFKLVCVKAVIMMTFTTVEQLRIFTFKQNYVWKILRPRSACAPTAYEVIRDWQKFENHCFKAWWQLYVGLPSVLSISNSAFCPTECVYRFHMILRESSGYILVQHCCSGHGLFPLR
jgi:hypothetical protein